MLTHDRKLKFSRPSLGKTLSTQDLTSLSNRSQNISSTAVFLYIVVSAYKENKCVTYYYYKMITLQSIPSCREQCMLHAKWKFG